MPVTAETGKGFRPVGWPLLFMWSAAAPSVCATRRVGVAPGGAELTDSPPVSSVRELCNVSPSRQDVKVAAFDAAPMIAQEEGADLRGLRPCIQPIDLSYPTSLRR